MAAIQTTTNYDRFTLHKLNRPINERHVRGLMKSMEKWGWIDAYPLHVVRGKRGGLEIKGGHHRYMAACRLGISLKFVICSDEATITELEEVNNGWTLRNYLDSFCGQRKKHYTELNEYIETTGVRISMAVALHHSSTSSTGCEMDKFKSGTFKIKDRELPERVALVVMAIEEEHGRRMSTRSSIVGAIARMCITKEFDVEHMIEQVRKYPATIKAVPDVEGNAKMLEKSYNHRARQGTRLPIAYISSEVAIARRSAGGHRDKFHTSDRYHEQ